MMIAVDMQKVSGRCQKVNDSAAHISQKYYDAIKVLDFAS